MFTVSRTTRTFAHQSLLYRLPKVCRSYLTEGIPQKVDGPEAQYSGRLMNRQLLMLSFFCTVLRQLIYCSTLLPSMPQFRDCYPIFHIEDSNVVDHMSKSTAVAEPVLGADITGCGSECVGQERSCFLRGLRSVFGNRVPQVTEMIEPLFRASIGERR